MAEKVSGARKPSYTDTLKAAGHEPKHAPADRRELSFKEKGTCYRMTFGRSCPTVSYAVDGEMVKDGNKCDYMALVGHEATAAPWTQVLVELKGVDIKHGLVQLEESLKHPMLNHDDITVRKARLAGRSFPSSRNNMDVERARKQFMSRYHCELKTVKSNQPDKIF